MFWLIKGSMGVRRVSVRLVIALACLFGIYYLCTTQTLFKDSLTIR